MKASGSERVMAWAAAVVLLAAGGCTNSEVIGTSTGGVSVTVEAQGGAGRYNLGQLSISQISLRLGDPDEQGALGDPFGLLARPILIDLNDPGVVTVQVGTPPGSSSLLSEGTYDVVATTTDSFTLVDEPPPDYGPTCPEMVDILAVAGNVTQTSKTTVEYQTPASLHISAAGTAELRLSINVAGMIGVFQSRFDCRTTANCSGGTPPPCLQSYRAPVSSQLEDYLVFQQQQ
jgi:hypothetical protein